MSEGMTDPADTPKRLYRKAARGKDESALPIVLGGVTLLVALVVAVVLTLAFLVYFLA
jgi:hypothetical protein